MSKRPEAFVPLRSLKQAPADPAQVLAEIRRIYFATTRDTIDNDFLHAIALLQSLPDEETRERATVFMQGLSEMQREWAPRKRGAGKGAGNRGSRRGKDDQAKTSRKPNG